MKYRIAGALLSVASLAFAVNVYAFTTASVNTGAAVSITTSDQLLAINHSGSTDNPAGMITRDSTTGKVTIAFGSNGTADKGIQGDATYTYDNVLRVKNNNATAKNINVALAGTAPTGVSVQFGVAAYSGTTCGTVSYSASPTAVSAAAGGEVCLSFKITTTTTVGAGSQNLAMVISAS